MVFQPGSTAPPFLLLPSVAAAAVAVAWIVVPVAVAPVASAGWPAIR